LLYVTSEEDGAVVVIDIDKHKLVKSVKVGPRPRSIAFLTDGSRAYVPSDNGATLTVMDTARLRPMATLKLGGGMKPMGTVMPRRKTSLRDHRSEQDGALRRHRHQQGRGLG
jgi:YVTN family beta-propeller protein